MTERRGAGARKTPAELRKFGLVMAAAFSVLAAVFWWRSRGAWPYCAGLAVLLAAPAMVWPRALAPVDRLWTRVGNVLSTVMTLVILTLAFYLVITPLALVLRLLGKDLLGLRNRQAVSYWIPVEPDGPGQRPDKPF